MYSNLIKPVDDFLNGITMYRLMLYFLIILTASSVILSFFHILPFKALDVLLSAIFLITVCWLSNKFFALFFKVPTNTESFFITALILSLILTPSINPFGFMALAAAAFLSQLSKYILAFERKHFFNPAAFGILMTAVFFKTQASWWIGTSVLMPLVLIGGLLIVKKLQRFRLVFSFLGISFFLIFILSILKGNNLTLVLKNTILESPFLFFAFVMLTEPLTTPSNSKRQTAYGGLIGLLSVYMTPETALLLGNLFSRIINRKIRFMLKLSKKTQLAPGIYDFAFESSKIAFLPGQYMEWTLGHPSPDSRGNRRYFTIASSPTEDNLRIGVKFYSNGSSFKRSLIMQKQGSKVFAGELTGEFTLPKDPGVKLCFIAGGIGITPYRSIIKYLLDRDERRDIILLYSAKSKEEFVYREIFDKAKSRIGLKTIYTSNRIDSNLISKEVSDYKDRTFYISGPHSMVDAFEKILKGMGISQIKVDFFPGYV